MEKLPSENHESEIKGTFFPEFKYGSISRWSIFEVNGTESTQTSCPAESSWERTL